MFLLTLVTVTKRFKINTIQNIKGNKTNHLGGLVLALSLIKTDAIITREHSTNTKFFKGAGILALCHVVTP